MSCFFREWAALTLAILVYPIGLVVPAPRPRESGGDRPPILLVPGYSMNHSCFLWLGTYLEQRGWRWVHATNHAPFNKSIATKAKRLGDDVERLKRASGADKIDIVGHSMGGLIAAYYIARCGGDAHVRRLITLGTPWRGTFVSIFGQKREARDMTPRSDVLESIAKAVVPTAALWSRWDGMVYPHESACGPEGAVAVELAHVGHNEMLTASRTFRLVADLLSATEMERAAPMEPTHELRTPLHPAGDGVKDPALADDPSPEPRV